MELVFNDDGTLSGKRYVDWTRRSSEPVIGRFLVSSKGTEEMIFLGFTVAWTEAEFCTTWNGYISSHNPRHLVTTHHTPRLDTFPIKTTHGVSIFTATSSIPDF